MEKQQGKGSAIYLWLLGGAAALCLAIAMWWMARGREQSPQPRYLLKDNAGHVALYSADGAGPLAEYDELYTRLLPERDVLALQQGVPIYNDTELQKRLEDYGL